MKATIYIASFSTVPLAPCEDGRGFTMRSSDASLISPLERRRMGRLARNAVASGLKCAEAVEKLDAIITATGYGLIEDTELFADAYLAQEEELVSPTYFMRSTFNSIGAQIAKLRQEDCYNNTVVHGYQSFPLALKEAVLLMQKSAVNDVLVGAFDEGTPFYRSLALSLGLGREYGLGEGCVFYHLSKRKEYLGSPILKRVEMEEPAGAKKAMAKWEEIFPAIITAGDYKSKCGEFPTASAYGVLEAIAHVKGANAPREVAVLDRNYQGCSLIAIGAGDR